MLAFGAGISGILLLLWAEWAQTRATGPQGAVGLVLPVRLIRGLGIVLALFSILLLFLLLYSA